MAEQITLLGHFNEATGKVPDNIRRSRIVSTDRPDSRFNSVPLGPGIVSLQFGSIHLLPKVLNFFFQAIHFACRCQRPFHGDR